MCSLLLEQNLILTFFFTSFVDYCRENKATVDVERKEKVEDIADILKRLKLLSSAASGEQQNRLTLAIKTYTPIIVFSLVISFLLLKLY